MFHQKSLIKVLMFIELMLVSCSLFFLGLFFDAPVFAPEGLLFPLIILTVAAAESAIGLALLILLYKKYHTVLISQFSVLRG